MIKDKGVHDINRLKKVSDIEYLAEVYDIACVKCGKHLYLPEHRKEENGFTECVAECCGINYVGWKKQIKYL